jgi:hypothetical protein
VVALSLSTLAAREGLCFHLREEAQVIAVSADGKHLLVEIEVSGPEGGRSLRYEVRDSARKNDGKPFAALVSNDLSRGSGSKEQISEGACRSALSALKEALSSAGFRGVAVNRDSCAARSQTIGVYYSMTTKDDPAWGTRGRPTFVSVSDAEFERAKGHDL